MTDYQRVKDNEEIMAYQERFGMSLIQARIYKMYLDGLTVSEMAEKMNKSYQNVDAQLSRALARVVKKEGSI